MERVYDFQPSGVCSRMFRITMKGDVIENVIADGGCNGNLQGLAGLLSGMRAEEAEARLSGIRCGDKESSCPDQIAKALGLIIAGEHERDD